MNYCPLGSGALAGTTYKTNRKQTAELLGFTAPMPNSLDGVSDRDFCVELCCAYYDSPFKILGGNNYVVLMGIQIR